MDPAEISPCCEVVASFHSVTLELTYSVSVPMAAPRCGLPLVMLIPDCVKALTNAQRACARGSCVTSLAPAYDKLGLPARSALNSQGIQLAHFTTKLSFLSSFARPFSIIEVATLPVQLMTISYERYY